MSLLNWDSIKLKYSLQCSKTVDHGGGGVVVKWKNTYRIDSNF